MRKVPITQNEEQLPEKSDSWLDLEKVAIVEISSEDPAFPIEHALGGSSETGETGATGWRAATPGPQRIRLLFDHPQTIRRIQLHFVDPVSERSQEFSIVAFAGGELRDVARQQWNFSPQGTTEEREDYKVELNGVTALELRIDPDRSHDPKQSQHFASLERLRLA
ncbi:MAG TPA: hypothetical protein VK596_07360 [Edaphobacter sp.]|nr:hypothetical protein [Edaphobacter sp.]